MLQELLIQKEVRMLPPQIKYFHLLVTENLLKFPPLFQSSRGNDVKVGEVSLRYVGLDCLHAQGI